ncbi:MAG TPA: glycosyltransferase family 2 protein [Verrucomicrobiae bacterium]|nr:glycosyltransferase family 2 protein [Verrucomicrobiae bacterium]
MDPQISVVVPMHNESPNVLPLAEQVFRAFANEAAEIELILVDDGSTDDTWAKILAAQKADARVAPVRHAKAAGQSAALWTGFKNARAPIIATLDGDLQNDPADLPMMVGLLAEADLVCGVRAKRADTFVRRASSKVARKARRAMLGIDFADTGCNLRVFKRSVLETIPGFDGIHRFMPIFAHNTGALVKEVPVRHHPRTMGVSKYGLWNRLGRGIRDLIMVRWFLKRQIGRKNLAA